jgi:hypothetical protein
MGVVGHEYNTQSYGEREVMRGGLCLAATASTTLLYLRYFNASMRLERAQIKNYRSIKSLNISFDPPCRILVGINESGKTNILNALGLLDPKRPSTQRDRREPGLDENPVTEAHVRFVLRCLRLNFRVDRITKVQSPVTKL